jgi:hypothetical protein
MVKTPQMTNNVKSEEENFFIAQDGVTVTLQSCIQGVVVLAFRQNTGSSNVLFSSVSPDKCCDNNSFRP